MRRHSLLLLIPGFFSCLLLFQTPILQAEPIPDISISSATGFISWGFFEANASLSGPDFTLAFTGPLFPTTTLAFPGFPFGAASGSGDFSLGDIHAENFFAEGGLTVNGTNYPVVYGGVSVTTLASTVVPSGLATIVLPATLTGSGPVCIAFEFSPGCMGTATIPPVYVANVTFDVPGFVTYHFVSTGVMGGVETERFTATFTPIPEPATVMLILTGLAVAFARKLSGRTGIQGRSN